MAIRTWQFSLDGQPHTVELEHGAISGKRRLRVDDETPVLSRKFLHAVFDTGGSYPFRIGGHSCAAEIRLRALGLLGFHYVLTVDGKTVDPQPVRPHPTGCLFTWLAWILLANGGTSLCYMSGLLSNGGLGGRDAPYMAAVYAVSIFVSLAYIGLSFAGLKFGKWAVLGLYGLTLVAVPLNILSFFSAAPVLFGGRGANLLSPTVWIPGLLMTLLSWLLGLMGVVILASLLQDSDCLSD